MIQPMNPTFDAAKGFFLQGLGHYQAGRYEQAAAQFEASLSLVPGRVSTLTNLGASLLKLGRMQEAAGVLEEALGQEPDNLEALGHRATALAEMGKHVAALATVERVLSLDPAQGRAWSLRGSLLKDMRRIDEAAQSFEKAIAHGSDPQLNGYYLASLRGGDFPPSPPRHYVEMLFDSYADDFDEHLVGVLNYRAHEVLCAPLKSMGRRWSSALDLGCGTGLCAPLVRPLAQRLAGVDLSAKMIARAGATGLYDQLEQADLREYLSPGARRHDLVLAADVFIYVGALDAVFEGVSHILEPGGMFCFSVEEAAGGAGLQLGVNQRYLHSESYVRALAAEHHFEVMDTRRHPIRDDQRAPIPGLFFWLRRS